ncbi:TatD family hydrolase [Patescibacteria group bacterium]|nr:TatD family hydrolase [Patescibacteria group bacterium]
MFELIDTHCHVHFQAYKEDMDAVVERALKSSVGMITVGTQSTTSANGIKLAERYDGVWAAVGLHPNHLHAQEFEDENELPPGVTADQHDSVKVKTRAERFDPEYYRPLVVHPKVVAVGEFGLDYYRLPPNVDIETLKADQMESVRTQLTFASDAGKPVVIHCRDAHADQARLLREEIDRGGLKRRGVVHCFTGTDAEASAYRDIGFYVSFTGIVAFGKNVMEAAKNVPLEQMLIETDSPYLTPPPHRGKRNEPSYVRFVAEKIAEIKGIPVAKVAEVTTENAVRLFGLA